MNQLVKQYCTELYPTDEEEGIGRVGNFAVYEAADVDAAIREARARGLEAAASKIEDSMRFRSAMPMREQVIDWCRTEAKRLREVKP
jgi:hypothetical protein